MSYKTACLARADCIDFWGLDDAGGATGAADSGTGAVTLPKIGTPTFGSTGFVAGLATSMSAVGGQSVGVAGTNFERTTALTICGWVQVVATSPQAGFQLMFGRDTLWGVYIANSLQVGALHDTTGMAGNVYNGTHPVATFGQVYAATDIMFLAASWSKETGLFLNVINGEMEANRIHDINFATGVGDTFRIGTGDAGHTNQIRYSGVALFNTQLGPGELRDLMAQNGSFTAPTQGNIEPASPSTVTSAGLFGAKVTARGAFVTTAGGKIYRPEEYGGSGLAQGGKTTPVSLGWDARLPFRAAQMGYEWFVTQVRRPSLRPPDGLTWYEGTGTYPWHSAQPSPPSDPGTTNSLIFLRTSGVAVLNHWIHGGVGGQDSVLTKLTTSLLDTLDANTDVNGLPFPPQSSGIPFQLWSDTVLAVSCIKPYVTTAKFNQWVAMLVKAGNWCFNLSQGGAAQYYVNGNQNLSAAVIFYGLFQLTGQQVWLDRYNVVWNTTMYPTDWNPVNSSGVNSAEGPARTAGFGLYKYVSGTYNWPDNTAPPQTRVTNDADLLTMNATTGKLILTESNNFGTGAATMGLDHDYAQLHLNQAWKLVWMTNQGARELRLFNCLLNQHITRITPGSATASWTMDATGGTRRNAIIDPYFEGILEYVRASGLRPDLTTNLLTHWESSIWPNWSSNWHGNGLMDRYLGSTIGNLLLGSPQWTGIPT